jgi:adenylylsulfate kinase
MIEEGWCVWITGLPGSGKSVVSESLIRLLNEKGIHAQLLSSDALRKILTPEPSYSLDERDMVYATLAYIAQLLTQNGVNVMIDATGNLRLYRENARKQIGKFIEAYLKCPLEICMQREAKRRRTYHAPKQIYDRARKGQASTVPGVGQPYEPPLNPEITIDTTTCTADESAEKILKAVLRRFKPNRSAR